MMLSQILFTRRPSQPPMRRQSLPVMNASADPLDLVEIPIPCDVPWDGMPGDDQVRHCGQCKQNVYNVAALTRAEASRLLRARACLRIYRRPDNTVITSDCRERLRAARKRGLLIFAGTLLIVLWAQICAQFVGVMGLRRLFGGGHATMGEPRPVPGQVAPPILVPQLPLPPVLGPPPIETMGLPPIRPLGGKPRPPKHIGKPRPFMGAAIAKKEWMGPSE
jgi:hypothetical protein